MGLDTRHYITFAQLSISLYAFALLVLILALSENFLGHPLTKGIKALKILIILILGPAIVCSLGFKLGHFPITLLSTVIAIYLKLAVWCIIKKVKSLKRFNSIQAEVDFELYSLIILAFVNMSFSVIAAALPTLTSHDMQFTSIIAAFMILLAIDLVLLAFESGLLTSILNKKMTFLENRHFYLLGIGVALSGVSTLSLFRKNPKEQCQDVNLNLASFQSVEQLILINISLFLLMYFYSLNIKQTLQAKLQSVLQPNKLSNITTHWLFGLLLSYFTNFQLPFCVLSLTFWFYQKLEALVRQQQIPSHKWLKYHNLNRSIVLIELIQWLSVASALLVPSSIQDQNGSLRAFYYASYYSSVFFFNVSFHIDNFSHFLQIKDRKPKKPKQPEPDPQKQKSKEQAIIPVQLLKSFEEPNILQPINFSSGKKQQSNNLQICAFLALYAGLYLTVFQQDFQVQNEDQIEDDKNDLLSLKQQLFQRRNLLTYENNGTYLVRGRQINHAQRKAVVQTTVFNNIEIHHPFFNSYFGLWVRAARQDFLFGQKITTFNLMTLEDHITLLNYIIMRSFDYRVQSSIQPKDLQRFIQRNKEELIHLVRYQGDKENKHELPVIRGPEGELFLCETDYPKNKVAERKFGKNTEMSLKNCSYKAVLSNRNFTFRKRFVTGKVQGIAHQQIIKFSRFGTMVHWRVFPLPETKEEFYKYYDINFRHFVQEDGSTSEAKVYLKKKKTEKVMFKLGLVVCSNNEFNIDELFTYEERKKWKEEK